MESCIEGCRASVSVLCGRRSLKHVEKRLDGELVWVMR
jgi:hypothetical protein